MKTESLRIGFKGMINIRSAATNIDSFYKRREPKNITGFWILQ
jgi:hypothetical protein